MYMTHIISCLNVRSKSSSGRTNLLYSDKFTEHDHLNYYFQLINLYLTYMDRCGVQTRIPSIPGRVLAQKYHLFGNTAKPP